MYMNGTVVKKGDTIELSYTGMVDNEIFDTTDEELAKKEGIYKENLKYGPITIMLGAGHIIKGLEEELIGKEVEYEGNVEIPPKKGFGDYKEDLKMLIPINKIKEDATPGMRVMVDGKIGTIERVVGRRALVDFNLPLAGKVLKYNYKIVRKIEDPIEQIKSLIKVYVNKDVDEVEISEDNIASIYVSYELSIDRQWMVFKKSIADDLLDNLDLKEVKYIERYRKTEKSDENDE
ncbi:MAG: peptidylprolyl isomerase [Candidatus Methanoliparum thermophilum]|uniref:Peptidyl-prolyl cis-trans isomerase n=2 Tax=Candidatus Methanoliparum TaxID=2545692 RepID=A0A520KQX8_METT2|nr:MAG: peptidylprolyl isomerase [Candidatus Methanoliparum thermophilum]BDC35710.1 peptidylprolyl isomerase [Candidatus Methanoliparum sp. LAM-1]